MIARMKSFCSNASIESEENILGTATFSDTYIFIKLEKRNWGFGVDDASGSDYFKNKINEIQNNGIKVVYFHGEERDPLFYLFSKKGFVAGASLDEIKSNLSFNNGAPQISFVCVHGLRDACCAKFGYSIFLELKKIGANVRQCSHLGGDRFAANMIVFPGGNCFGHLRSLRSMNKNELSEKLVFSDNYRGCIFLPPQVQMAIGFFINSGDVKSTQEFNEFATWTQDSENMLLVQIREVEYRLVFEKQEHYRFGDCKRLNENKQQKFQKWKLISANLKQAESK